MSARPRVLLILPYAPASFMQTDVAILERHCRVDTVVHTQGKRRLLRNVLGKLGKHPPDLLLLWFVVPSYALPFAVLGKLRGVRVAFITGGYDVVSMPEIGFGALRIPLFRWLLRPTLRVADLTIPFSQDAVKQIRKYAHPRRVAVVYPGVDTEFFTPGPEPVRAPLAVTVSPVSAISIAQKGLSTFVEAARGAPAMRFVLVGRALDGSLDALRAGAPPNVEFVDRFLPAPELRDLYRRASCYVQASLHEGFGIAVAEAMACGAVPVVTERFSLPEVTGGLGESIPVADPAATAAAILRTRSAPPTLRQACRARVVANFPLARRERELMALIGDMTRRR